MSFQISEKHVDEYHLRGFTILQGVIPASLIKDLRAEAVNFRESAAGDQRLADTAQWQLQPIAKHFNCLRAFRDYECLAPLRDALASLLTTEHTHANIE